MEIPEINLTLDISSNGTGNVTVKTFKEDPTSGFSIPALNIFFDINVSGNIADEMNETILKVFYTDAEVSALGIDESTLRLYFFNVTLNNWQVQKGGVNTTGNYVWAETNHFSTWGIFGNAVVVSSPANTGGGGGGGSITWPKVTNETASNETESNETIVDETESVPEDGAISPLRDGINTITGAVVGTVNKDKNIRNIVVAILIIGGMLMLISRIRGGMIGASYFTRASNLHRRAGKAHMKGNYTKSGKLYGKAQILREKGERKSFKEVGYGGI